MKRRQEAAAAVGFTLYDKGVGAVVGGKLDAAIRSEMRNAYPDVQQHEIEAKWKVMMEILDCEIRYMFLLNFQHAVPGLKEGIIAKIAPDLPWFSRTYASLRASTMDKSKQMRYNMLKSLQVSYTTLIPTHLLMSPQLHVETAVCDAPDVLQGCLSVKALVGHFRELYTPENFLQAFGFIQHYIDIKKKHRYRSLLHGVSILALLCENQTLPGLGVRSRTRSRKPIQQSASRRIHGAIPNGRQL